MAHYCFLGSWDHPRMPSGDKNEWQDYFDSPGEELEAKNAIPLLWALLFSENDLRRARFIEDVDRANVEERRDFLEDGGYGPDATYPYFITAKPDALIRLKNRRSTVLREIGEVYTPIYDGFIALIETEFRSYIFVRTSGLPDADSAEGWLRRDAASVDRLESETTIQAEGSLAERIADFVKWQRHNPIWLLSGEGSRYWPPETLAATFPEGRTRQSRMALPPIGQGNVEPSGVRKFMAEWVSPILAAAAGLGAYYVTSSFWLGALAFLIMAFLLAYIWTRPRRG